MSVVAFFFGMMSDFATGFARCTTLLYVSVRFGGIGCMMYPLSKGMMFTGFPLFPIKGFGLPPCAKLILRNTKKQKQKTKKKKLN